MAISFNIYLDAGLTVLAPNPLSFTFPEDAVQGVWEQQQLYLGSTNVARRIVDAAAPLAVNIVIDLLDNDPSSPGTPEADDAELSLDGLAWFTPQLDLGVLEVLGGVSNAIPFWVRTQIFDGPSPGVYNTSVFFETQQIEEIDV